MQSDGFNGPLTALRRKLKALAAIAGDQSATAAERENAEALRRRLEERLRAVQVRPPAGDWTDHAFRLGRWVGRVRPSGAPAADQTDWTDHARRLGKAVRRGYRKLLSD